jgi:hypothetical protein
MAAILSIALFLPLTVVPVRAEDGPDPATRQIPEIRAMRVDSASPQIDGRLDDPVWNSPSTEYARGFTQREPDDGVAATESTAVAVVYDDDAIYFAWWCYDSKPEKITRRLVRRDRGTETDWVELRIDPYHDHQTGYAFEVSAAGVQRDYRLYDDVHWDVTWDAVWASAVRMQPWGWSVEMRIPYQCLRFAENDEEVWGVDFARGINRKAEYNLWAHTPVSESGYVSKFGHLTGLSGIRPPPHLEFLPHVVTSYQTEPATEGNRDGRDYGKNAGLTFKYGLYSNLTLDATLNPDFGQVELDRPVLNLSTFETWYPERRPFFMEGSELFQTPFDLFYSRRIGRAPRGDVSDVDDDFDYYTHYPSQTTILGAAKLTGKLHTGTSVAFLGAVTEEERAQYAAEIVTLDSTSVGDSVVVDTLSVETALRDAVVEPETFYSVLRLKQDVLASSSVGGTLTLASPTGAHSAVTGGVDWRLRTDDNAWSFFGQTVASRVDTENVGRALNFGLEKTSGEHVRGSIGGTLKDRHLDLDDLGFTRRNDIKSGWLWMQYRTTDDWWIVRNSWNNVNYSASWNGDGANIGRNWNFNNTIEFVDNSHAWMVFSQTFPKYDDRETRGHGLWEVPASWHAYVGYDTDERKKWSVELDYIYGESRTHPWWGAELLVRYRPADNMTFSVHGDYTHDPSQLYWVENPDDDTTIFADKDQDIFNLNASTSIVFSPTLSCQLSGQGLLTGLDYRNYRPYLGDGCYGPCETGYNHDYHYTALNSTFLLRWEYMPGSTLYLVWTRMRSEVDDSLNNLDMTRDFDRFFTGDAENVFLIKTSYWFSI